MLKVRPLLDQVLFSLLSNPLNWSTDFRHDSIQGSSENNPVVGLGNFNRGSWNLGVGHYLPNSIGSPIW